MSKCENCAILWQITLFSLRLKFENETKMANSASVYDIRQIDSFFAITKMHLKWMPIDFDHRALLHMHHPKKRSHMTHVYLPLNHPFCKLALIFFSQIMMKCWYLAKKVMQVDRVTSLLDRACAYLLYIAHSRALVL